MSISIKPYVKGNEEDILALFQRAYGRRLSMAYWGWRFLQNPVDVPQVELAWDKHKLVGHYAVSPNMLRVGDDEKKVALSMTTMTDPEYQGRDIFGRLADSLYDRLAANDYTFVYGFPNKQSHRIFNRRLEWNDIGEISSLTLSVSEARPSATEDFILEETSIEQIRITEYEPFTKSTIHPVRNRQFYNWRLRSPHESYRIFAVVAKNIRRGFAIVKTYGEDSLDLVDMYVEPESAEPLLSLLLQFAEFHGFAKIQTWANLWHPYRSTFEKLGFAPSSPVTMLGARWFTRESIGQSYVFADWQLPMLASDVY